MTGAFFLAVDFLAVCFTGSVILDSLDFNLAALLAWMSLVLTALSRLDWSSWKTAGEGVFLIFLIKFLKLASITAL